MSFIHFTSYIFGEKALFCLPAILVPPSAKAASNVSHGILPHYQQPLHRKLSLACPRKETLASTGRPGIPHSPEVKQGFRPLSGTRTCSLEPQTLSLQPCPGRRIVSEMHAAFPTAALQSQPQTSPLIRLPPSDSTFHSPCSSLSPPKPFHLITASYPFKLSPYPTRSCLCTQGDCHPLTPLRLPK